MRIRGIEALAVLTLAGCHDEPGAPDGPVWWRDVAPIVYENCASCHREGGIGPGVLTSYDDARAAGAAMREQTHARTMPPWHVDSSGDCNSYREARTLTDAEIATIGAWVDAEMPEGDPAQAPAPISPPELAGVTHTLEMGVDYQPNLSAADDYRCFIVDPNLAEDMYLTSYQVMPGNAAMVHHVILFSLDTQDVEQLALALDEADEGPGYTCFGTAGVPASPIAGWAPGTPITQYPNGTGIVLRAQRKLVMQLHYNLKNDTGSDRTRVDLVLASSVPKPSQLLPIANGELTLPPGQEKIDTSMTTQLMRNLEVHAVFPHMHKLGRSLHHQVTRGDETICLVNVPDWSFDWQQFYIYEQPVALRPGDRMTLGCSYDTRGKTTTTTFGEGSDDEMCVSFLYASREPSPFSPTCGVSGDRGELPPSGGACAATGFECNPVTNEPCDTAAGEACDIAGIEGFQCYPPPNDTALCKACDQDAGPWCRGGATCLGVDRCAKYCCNDSDCGEGSCVKTMGDVPWFEQAPELGLCLDG
ncbi:MAG TPA: hypothetical protein VFB62_19830 [Polyangiaceae bacterium]|nr:hypothetical protein [Polyangiaceae bacterium]